MTSHLLSGDYLRWLASQIRGEENKTYDGLFEIMYEKEFVWLIPNDDNRKGDGLDLRVEFCYAQNIRMGRVGAFLDKDNPDPPCSFLEVLVALSRRLEFAAGGSAPGWAWELITNLKLHRIMDPIGRAKARKANDILEKCIWRNYPSDGEGGFFPLSWPDEDQTQIELWYQMAAYINESYMER